MTKCYDRQGREVIRLSRGNWAGIYAPAAVIISLLGWLGVELLNMRDAIKAETILQGKDHEELVDHEVRIRYLEGHTPRTRSTP